MAGRRCHGRASLWFRKKEAPWLDGKATLSIPYTGKRTGSAEPPDGDGVVDADGGDSRLCCRCSECPVGPQPVTKIDGYVCLPQRADGTHAARIVEYAVSAAERGR
ncbi:hypothetical protein ACUV84_017948 [Puccinellia chinampoensis]